MPPTEQRGWFHFDPHDSIYADHFPGYPVVPGTLIIEAFLKGVEQVGIEATALSRFRFKTFISPGPYEYRLKITPDTVYCVLLCNEKEVVTGKIIYGR